MRLPTLKELLEKTRYEKETGKKLETPYDEYTRIMDKFDNQSDLYIFGQYSNEHKLGVNPQSKFNTPIGIYSYPLAYIPASTIQSGRVPYAGDRKYLVMFTVKQSYRNKIVIVDQDGVISAESPIKDDYIERKIEEKTPNLEQDIDTEFRKVFNAELNRLRYELNKLEQFKTQYTHYYFDMLGDVITKQIKLALKPTGEQWKSRTYTSVNKFMDMLEDVINHIIPSNREFDATAIFFHDFQNDVEKWEKDKKGDVYDTVVQARSKARIQSTIGKYWNVTRELNKNPVKWAKMMMNDGIYGVIDEGSGIIHPAEPTQACFFSKEVLELVSIIDNPAIKSKYRKPEGKNVLTKKDYNNLLPIHDKLSYADIKTDVIKYLYKTTQDFLMDEPAGTQGVFFKELGINQDWVRDRLLLIKQSPNYKKLIATVFTESEIKTLFKLFKYYGVKTASNDLIVSEKEIQILKQLYQRLKKYGVKESNLDALLVLVAGLKNDKNLANLILGEKTFITTKLNNILKDPEFNAFEGTGKLSVAESNLLIKIMNFFGIQPYFET